MEQQGHRLLRLQLHRRCLMYVLDKLVCRLQSRSSKTATLLLRRVAYRTLLRSLLIPNHLPLVVTRRGRQESLETEISHPGKPT